MTNPARRILRRRKTEKGVYTQMSTKLTLLEVLNENTNIYLSGQELADRLGISRNSVWKAMKKLQEQGAVNVLVSMAGDGAVLIAEDGSVYESDAPKGKVVNSVGAGDSMVAGFLAGYLQTGRYEEAFKMGICTGSASAFSEKLATKREVEEIMRTHTFHF